MNGSALRDQVLAVLRNAREPLGLAEILNELGDAYRSSHSVVTQVLDCLAALTREQMTERVFRWRNRPHPSWRLTDNVRKELAGQTWVWP
jgi:hypothetical protein